MEALSSTAAQRQWELTAVKQSPPSASGCSGVAYEALWLHTTLELLRAVSNNGFASITLEQTFTLYAFPDTLWKTYRAWFPNIILQKMLEEWKVADKKRQKLPTPPTD